MRVWTELGEAGASRAAGRGDVVVLVDALRASVTITAALAVGACRVIPVLEVDQARAYLGQRGFLVAGERQAQKVPGFDLGNSPAELLRQADRLRGQTLVLTTSNGTRCVEAAREGACAVLAGSLPNAQAVTGAAYRLAAAHGRDITLLAAGQRDGPAVEDEYSAAVLAGRLTGLGAEADVSEPTMTAEVAFCDTPHGRRLVRLGYGQDLELCRTTDLWEVVGVLQGDGFVVERGTG